MNATHGCQAFQRCFQIKSNVCIRFFLNLNDWPSRKKEFKDIDWLPINERLNQRICMIALNFFNNTAPTYISDMCSPSKVMGHKRLIAQI